MAHNGKQSDGQQSESDEQQSDGEQSEFEERQAEFKALQARLMKQACKMLQSFAQPLTTDLLKTMCKHCLTDCYCSDEPLAKATFRALCLGLLRLQNSTDKSTGIPFTRVDPAVIEESFSTLMTAGEFFAFDSGAKPFAALITVEVDGLWKYIFATLTSRGVEFEDIKSFSGSYYLWNRALYDGIVHNLKGRYNILHISKEGYKFHYEKPKLGR